MKELSNDIKIKMYEDMLLIRYFEKHVSKLRFDGNIVGAVHCSIGEEAISVGTCTALDKDDFIVSNHRCHGHMIAKGGNINRILAEIYGKQTGTNGGRGGSLHICDPEISTLGATGIVGSGLPIACGSAFASKRLKDEKITVVFLGDGASNEGTFHESINLAATWKLPIIFLIENNGMAVTTSNTKTTSNLCLYERSLSYGIEGIRIDGQDVETVYNTVKNAREKILSGSGPILIEACTIRFHEHAEGKGYLRMQNTGYRDANEIEKNVREHDPIVNYEKKLLESNIINTTQVLECKNRVQEKIKSADEFARKSPVPNKETAYMHVFSE